MSIDSALGGLKVENTENIDYYTNHSPELPFEHLFTYIISSSNHHYNVKKCQWVWNCS